MFKSVMIAFFSIFLLSMPIAAEPLEGEYLYKVTTMRIERGKLKEFLAWYSELNATSVFEDAGTPRPMLMRHSQGDQWDLLKIEPMGSWTAYHARSRVKRRGKAAEKHADLINSGKAMIAFSEDVFAYGPSLEVIQKAYEENAFYHIEMFEAAPGKAGALFEQRRMENAYLAATGQTENMIFRRAAGSDVDVFTIGFHESLQTFSTPSGASKEEAEAAAVAAGFKNRADISFLLRSLISGHHDTLAVKVE